MHELSIADAIVGIAERNAGGRRVTRVEVELGALRQVVPGALAFAFELVAEGTAVAGAELDLALVGAAGRCAACGEESELDGFPLVCRACGSGELELLRGEELRVVALELADEPVVMATTTGGRR